MSAPAKTTLGSIEVLRVAAVLGVIWFHINSLPFRQFAYSGLIVFILLTIVLTGVSSNRSSSLKEFCTKRFQRLLIPWAFWFSVYFLANLCFNRPPLTYQGDWISAILAGPWIGLWYLPFAFVVTVVCFYWYQLKFDQENYPILLALLACGIGFLFLAEFARKNSVVDRPPWPQWLHATAAIFFGFSISRFLLFKKPVLSFVLIISVPLTYFIFRRSDPGLVIPYVVAIPLTALAFVVPVKVPPLILSLGSLTMGVYLVHGAFISVLKQALPHGTSTYVLFFLTSIASFACAFVIKNTPLIRHTV